MGEYSLVSDDFGAPGAVVLRERDVEEATLLAGTLTSPRFTVEAAMSLVESAEFNKHIFPCLEKSRRSSLAMTRKEK
jgi:hypothetical protein